MNLSCIGGAIAIAWWTGLPILGKALLWIPLWWILAVIYITAVLMTVPPKLVAFHIAGKRDKDAPFQTLDLDK